VTARYSGLARAARSGQQIVDCGADAFEAGCFGAAGYDDTSELPDGAVRASLGCGNPVAVAQLRPGQTVLDLGSGGGIDVLLSARRVAPGGKAYGLDGSPDMIALAQDNAVQAGIGNVEFLHGHIEAIPLPEASVDVVISNCVINRHQRRRGWPALSHRPGHPALRVRLKQRLRRYADARRWREA